MTEIDIPRTNQQGTLATRFGSAASTLDLTTEETFAIGMENATFIDAPAELDNSGENVTLGLVARGLDSVASTLTTQNATPGTASSFFGSATPVAATAQNGPVIIHIVQRQTDQY